MDAKLEFCILFLKVVHSKCSVAFEQELFDLGGCPFHSLMYSWVHQTVKRTFPSWSKAISHFGSKHLWGPYNLNILIVVLSNLISVCITRLVSGRLDFCVENLKNCVKTWKTVLKTWKIVLKTWKIVLKTWKKVLENLDFCVKSWKNVWKILKKSVKMVSKLCKY